MCSSCSVGRDCAFVLEQVASLCGWVIRCFKFKNCGEAQIL